VLLEIVDIRPTAFSLGLVTGLLLLVHFFIWDWL